MQQIAMSHFPIDKEVSNERCCDFDGKEKNVVFSAGIFEGLAGK